MTPQDAPPSTPPDAASADADPVDRLLGSRWLIPGVSALLVLALAFFVYAVHSFLDTACYEDMQPLGLDTATSVLLGEVGGTVSALKNGPGDGVQWESDLLDALRASSLHVAEGRRALKRHEGLSALGAISNLEKSLGHAKKLATDRVNHILQVQDPANPEAFEKFRLEGKSLVDAVRDIDIALLTLAERSRKLPGRCDW